MYTPFLPVGVSWIKGQLELGAGGFLHWQLIVAMLGKRSRSQVRGLFGPVHCELSRSEAAEEYVWKEETRVPETQFELGAKPIRRNVSEDWNRIWEAATIGDLLSIPAQVIVL